MRCPNCSSYQSGDFCQQCGTVFREKVPVVKINKRSEKGKEDDKKYFQLRAKFLKQHLRCAVYPELKAVDVHHKRGRGKYYLDVSTWLPVSRKAHTEIEANPEWAIEMGYSELRLKNYDIDDKGEAIQRDS